MAVKGVLSPGRIFGFWVPVGLWMGFIFYGSSIPGKDIPPLFPYQDIAYHLLVYLILAYLFARAMHNSCSSQGRCMIVLITLAFGILYGISDEFHQRFISERLCSGFDVVIDGIGTFIGSIFFTAKRYVRQ